MTDKTDFISALASAVWYLYVYEREVHLVVLIFKKYGKIIFLASMVLKIINGVIQTSVSHIP